MKPILIIALCVLTFFSEAQQISSSYAKTNSPTQSSTVSFGIKAGVNIADLKDNQTNAITSIVNFHGGVFINVRLSKLIALEPEVIYSAQGAKYAGFGTEDADYINIPVLFQYLFPASGFRLETGPQVGILTSAKLNRNSGGTTDIKYQLTSSDIAWSFGLSYLSSIGLGIDGRYNLGLTNIANTDTHNVKNMVWQFGLFYQLPK